MIKVTLLAATLALAGLAHAQSSPAKKELVAKLLQLQQPGVEALAANMAQQPAAMLMQQAGPALQRMPAERRDALARDIEADVRKYIEEATPIVRDRAVKLAPTTIGPLMEERFSEDELKQIIAILESPVNKKFQSLLPEMQRAISEKLVAETRNDVEIKVRAMQTTVAARLGITPQPAASAPKAGAATPKK